MSPPPGTLVQAEDWALNGFPIPATSLGQLSAVAIDPHGDLHVLHRGPIVWDIRYVQNTESFEEKISWLVSLIMIRKFVGKIFFSPLEIFASIQTVEL